MYCTLCSRQVCSRNHGCGSYRSKFLPMCTLANVQHLSVHTLVESDPYPMAGCDAMVSSPWCTDGSTGVHHFNRYLVIRVHICRLDNLAISPIILCVQKGVESIYCEAKTVQQWLCSNDLVDGTCLETVCVPPLNFHFAPWLILGVLLSFFPLLLKNRTVLGVCVHDAYLFC